MEFDEEKETTKLYINDPHIQSDPNNKGPSDTTGLYEVVLNKDGVCISATGMKNKVACGTWNNLFFNKEWMVLFPESYYGHTY